MRKASVAEVEFAAIDFESITAQGEGIPIQIGLARMNGWTLLPNTFFRSYLQASCHAITCSARVVRKVNPEQLLKAPSLLSLWPVVRTYLQGRHVVAHSAGSEKRYLRAFPFHGFGPWIDTLQLARVLYPGLGNYSLGYLVTRLKIVEEAKQLCDNLEWHDALYDAVASLLLLRTLMDTQTFNTINHTISYQP